jgi:neutral trehalase
MRYPQPQTSGALFQAVQRARLFADSNTFPDCIARRAPELIEREFRELLRDRVTMRVACGDGTHPRRRAPAHQPSQTQRISPSAGGAATAAARRSPARPAR